MTPPSSEGSGADIAIVQRDKSELAAGYSRFARTLEITSMILFLILVPMIVARIYPLTDDFPWAVAIGYMGGWVAADFISGLVHWGADTWGTPDVFLVGPALIRPFREHHVDQESITRHDFVETNGNSCLVSLPVLTTALFIPLSTESAWNLFLVTAMLSLTLWVFLTNQIHKWSHQSERHPIVMWLQKKHIILPREHHAIHHRAPFATHYCITTGWLNMPLARLKFFRKLERFITARTGALPRADDIGVEAARKVLLEQT